MQEARRHHLERRSVWAVTSIDFDVDSFCLGYCICLKREPVPAIADHLVQMIHALTYLELTMSIWMF